MWHTLRANVGEFVISTFREFPKRRSVLGLTDDKSFEDVSAPRSYHEEKATEMKDSLEKSHLNVISSYPRSA